MSALSVNFQKTAPLYTWLKSINVKANKRPFLMQGPMSLDIDPACDLGCDDAFRLLSEDLKFDVLDRVFQGFVDTNCLGGHRRPFGEILATPCGRKDFYSYEHLGISYLATVFKRVFPRGEWLNIKLNCNGFLWPLAPSSSRRVEQPRHNSDGWVVIPRNLFFQSFPRMTSSLAGADYACMYYAREARRVDIKFFFDSTGSHVLVTYEMGTPYFDDSLDDQYRFRMPGTDSYG
jgi:hypothetical protein